MNTPPPAPHIPDPVAKSAVQSSMVVSIVVVGLVVVATILSALVYASVTQLSNSVDVQQDSNARTECVRTINNEINDQRWNYIYGALAESQQDNDVAAADNVQKGRALEGVIIKRTEAECPPSKG